MGGGTESKAGEASKSLSCPLSPARGTARCPNCKDDERIKKLEFGCDCFEKQSRMGMEGWRDGSGGGGGRVGGGVRLFIWSILDQMRKQTRLNR